MTLVNIQQIKAIRKYLQWEDPYWYFRPATTHWSWFKVFGKPSGYVSILSLGHSDRKVLSETEFLAEHPNLRPVAEDGVVYRKPHLDYQVGDTMHDKITEYFETVEALEERLMELIEKLPLIKVR